MEPPTGEDETMARRSKLDTVNEAIRINGHMPVWTERGTLQVRQITGTAKNGNWITDCLTSDLRGYVQLRKQSHSRWVAWAEDVIARRDEIGAERERSRRVAYGRD